MHPLPFSRVLLVAACTCGAELAAAGAPARRELTTDRPDSTETPFTVEPGRVQVEASAASYVRDRQGGVRTEEWEIAPGNVRIGLGPRTEFGVFVSPHVSVTEQPRDGAKTRVRGVGDTVLRGKLNFTGNDGGDFGSGVFVDVKLPTAADGLGNGRTDYAVTFPVTFPVGLGWEGAGMTVVEWARTAAARREAAWTNTVSFARDLGETVGTFLELVSTTGTGRHQLVFDVGLTWRVRDDLQLDAGVNLGVSRTAPDLGVFAGFARRF